MGTNIAALFPDDVYAFVADDKLIFQVIYVFELCICCRKDIIKKLCLLWTGKYE